MYPPFFFDPFFLLNKCKGYKHQQGTTWVRTYVIVFYVSPHTGTVFIAGLHRSVHHHTHTHSLHGLAHSGLSILITSAAHLVCATSATSVFPSKSEQNSSWIVSIFRDVAYFWVKQNMWAGDKSWEGFKSNLFNLIGLLKCGFGITELQSWRGLLDFNHTSPTWEDLNFILLILFSSFILQLTSTHTHLTHDIALLAAATHNLSQEWFYMMGGVSGAVRDTG